jgi:hypothetical protein
LPLLGACRRHQELVVASGENEQLDVTSIRSLVGLDSVTADVELRCGEDKLENSLDTGKCARERSE